MNHKVRAPRMPSVKQYVLAYTKNGDPDYWENVYATPEDAAAEQVRLEARPENADKKYRVVTKRVPYGREW